MARRDEEFTISFKGAYVEKDMALTCGRGYVAHPLSSRQWEEIKLEQAGRARTRRLTAGSQSPPHSWSRPSTVAVANRPLAVPSFLSQGYIPSPL
jgi:hypothetical protein